MGRPILAALLALAGCHRPRVPAGSGCTDAADCPLGLVCQESCCIPSGSSCSDLVNGCCCAGLRCVDGGCAPAAILPEAPSRECPPDAGGGPPKCAYLHGSCAETSDCCGGQICNVCNPLAALVAACFVGCGSPYLCNQCLVPNGSSCDQDSDCLSGSCQSGVCAPFQSDQ